MAKYIHNKTGSTKTYQGRAIDTGVYYQIPDNLLIEYASDDTVLTDITSGDIAISANGSSDIASISEQINFLKSLDLAPKDSDGSPLSRVKITTTGWSYQLHGIEVKTSQLDSIYSKNQDGTNFGFTTLKCYDSNNNQLTTQEDCDTNCVKTVVDWEPTYDYEIVGGFFKQASIPSSDIRLWVVGVPDVPAQYGGSKLFTANINLKYVGLEEGIKVDGRAPKYMTYNATYHSNKLRMILKHNAGEKHDVHVVFELFKV